MPKKRGWLKQGCLGCGAVMGVLLLIFLGFTAIGLVNAARDPEPEQLSLTADVPGLDRATVAGEAALADAAGGTPEQELSLPAPGSGADPVPGKVVLDLSMGQFEVVPAAAGEPFRVEADFDSARFRLKQKMTEDDDGWVYKVDFGPKGGLLGASGVNVDTGKIVIHLPQGVPFDLAVDVGIGESRFDLSGLDLRSLKWKSRMGEHDLRFDDRSPGVMSEARFEARMGELTISDLGNASPESVTLKGSMGSVNLGLDGFWKVDPEVQATFRMGEIRVDVPSNSRLDHKVSVAMGEKFIAPGIGESDRPDAVAITLKAKLMMGGVQVR